MRLKTDPQLRALSDELSETQALLHRLPARRAPRNFTLTPKMAGVKPPVPRVFPLFRFASALAAILFFFSFAVNLTVPAFSAMRAAAPMAYGIGGGNGNDLLETPAPAAPEAAAQAPAAGKPAATEAPAALAPAAPAPTMSAQDTFALTPTPEAARTMAEAVTETPAQTEMPQAKSAPTEPPAPMSLATPVPPPPVEPPIPLAVLIGLLILALVAGAAALFVRWQADRKFNGK
jgi:hypothetical protein